MLFRAIVLLEVLSRLTVAVVHRRARYLELGVLD